LKVPAPVTVAVRFELPPLERLVSVAVASMLVILSMLQLAANKNGINGAKIKIFHKAKRFIY
jgi:hypothetical protein